MFHETLIHETRDNGTVEVSNVNDGAIVHIVPAFLAGEFDYWEWFAIHPCTPACTGAPPNRFWYGGQPYLRIPAELV